MQSGNANMASEMRQGQPVMHENHEARHEDFAAYLLQVRRDELLAFLEAQQEPAWECELLRVACPAADMLAGPPLEMYRWHFVLFHVLYQLVPEFAARGQYLYIHFMRTCTRKYPEPGNCRYFLAEEARFCGAPGCLTNPYCDFHRNRVEEQALDCLSDRYFYLDPANFTALSSDNAEKFIAGAWNLLQNRDEYLNCLAIMGLPEGVAPDLLKKRFRHLAKTLHPDLNPIDHQKFAQINSAYRKLLTFMGSR